MALNGGGALVCESGTCHLGVTWLLGATYLYLQVGHLESLTPWVLPPSTELSSLLRFCRGQHYNVPLQNFRPAERCLCCSELWEQVAVCQVQGRRRETRLYSCTSILSSKEAEPCSQMET